MFSEKLYNQILKRKIYNSIEEKPSIFRGGVGRLVAVAVACKKRFLDRYVK